MKTHTTKTKNKAPKWWLALVALSLSWASASAQNCHAGYTYVLDEPNKTFTFTNTSTGTGPLNYYWSFGDGAYSTEQNPVHTYANKGWIAPILQVFGPDSCYSYYGDTIMLGACWSELSVSGYMNALSPDFQNYSQGGEYYFWSFGDGATSTAQTPTHTYANYGTYNVCLTIGKNDSSCSDTKCFQYKAGLNSQNCIADFNWWQTGNFSIAFSDSSLSNANANLNYYWSFGDGTTSTSKYVTHGYADSGYYNVCLTIYSNDSTCSSNICKQVYVQGFAQQFSCMAEFSAKPYGNTISFTNFSSGPFANVFWTFGDGSTSTAVNPLHSYSDTGSYNVCLTVYSNDSACYSKICKSVVVNTTNGGVCNAAFTYGVTGNSISAINTSAGNYTQSYWEFGDGSTSSVQNPTHQYADSGVYNVCLTIYSADSNCYSKLCKTVFVNPSTNGPCNASIYHYVQGNTVYLTNTSTGSYSGAWWKFSDENYWRYDNGSAISHTFPQAGYYQVALALSDTSNWCDSALVGINIGSNLSCLADFSSYADTAQNYPAVYFWDNSTTNVNSTYSYQWTFGDGTSSTEKNPVHLYTSDGTYQVCFTFTSADTMCKGSVCKNVYVQQPNSNYFQISFSNVINPVCSNATAGSATAVASGGVPPYTYSWFIGQTTATATGLGVGTYIVAVTDAANHLQTANVTLTQQSPLQIMISVTVDPTDNSVDFHSTVTGDAGGLNYMWYLGEDSAYAYTSSPKHKYVNEGYYTVCMSVYDSLACSAQLCDTLHLYTDSLGNYHAALLRLGQQATTVNELNNKVQIGVYPNPAKDETAVSFNLKQEAQIEVLVCDLLGNTVAILDNGMRNDGTYTYKLNTTELSEGVYFVKLNNNGIVSTQKIVVIK